MSNPTLAREHIGTMEDAMDRMAHHPSEIVDRLNKILSIDPIGISNLFKQKAECNRFLADHPSVQVGQENSPNGKTTVGPLGLLNGILGSFDMPDCELHQFGPIMALWASDTHISEFILTTEWAMSEIKSREVDSKFNSKATQG